MLKRWSLPGDLAIPAAAALVLGYLVAFPIGALVWDSLHVPDSEGLTLSNFERVYSAARTWQLVWNSMLYALGTASLSLVLGTTLAWIVERTNTWGRHLVYGIILVPVIIPSVITTLAWIFLLSPNIGWINVWLRDAFGLSTAPFNVFSLAGMIWIEALNLTPLVFLLMAAAFKSMDPALEEAAQMSGAGTLATVRRVTLRLVTPALAACALIAIVRGLESFEVPALVGVPARVPVLTSEIFLAFRQFPSDFGKAGALSLGLLLVSAAGVWLYGRLVRTAGTYSTISGKAYRPAVFDLGRWRVATGIILLTYLLIFIAMPFAVLVWVSLLPFIQPPSTAALAHISLQNYAFVLDYPRAETALRNSALLGVGAATVVVLLTSVLAWITVKTRLRGREIIDILAFLPIGIPGLVLGVAIILQYVAFPIPIYGTLWVLLIAYTTKFLPFGMRALSASMVQIHRELEEAAIISGAGWWRTFRRVTLPLLRPGLVAAWVYVFVIASRELSTSILLATAESNVIALLIFDLYEAGVQTTVAALAVMLVIGLVMMSAVVYRLSARFGVVTQ